MDIKAGLSFQIEVSFLDLGNKEIPLYKLGDFHLYYYIDNQISYFEASRVGTNYLHCEAVGNKIVATVTHDFIIKGRLKCQMEYYINDDVLPTSPFKFYCPEQLLDIWIV